MRISGLLFIAVAVVVLAPFAISAADNKLPADVQAILDKADTIELLSLESTDKPAKDDFHGYKVLGKAKLKGADTRKVIAAIEKGIQDFDALAAQCNNPRHGVRVSLKDKTVDLVICYECRDIVSYLGDNEERVYTSNAPQTVINKLLKDAKVPLPK